LAILFWWKNKFLPIFFTPVEGGGGYVIPNSIHNKNTPFWAASGYSGWNQIGHNMDRSGHILERVCAINPEYENWEKVTK
jgi:hypothetical protein